LWPPKPSRIAERIFSAKGMFLARAKTGEQRSSQHFGRHGFIDRGVDGPAAFAESSTNPE